MHGALIEDLRERKFLAMGLLAAVVTMAVNALANFPFHLAAIASLVVVLTGALVRLSTEPKEESPPTAPVKSQDKFLRVLVALSAVVFTFIGIRYCFNFYRASAEANLAYTIISAIQAGQVPNEVDRRAYLLVAQRRLELANRLDPYHSDIYMLQGGAYRLQNRFEPARVEYEKAIYYAPSCEAYSALGATYLRLGQVDKAREAYRRALEFNPKFEPAQQGMQSVNNATAKTK